MTTSNKQTVLVFGATGSTGTSIINGLLESKNFDVSAAIRASSQDKPLVAYMRSKGVAIHLVDHSTVISSPPNTEYNTLVSILKTIDTAIAVTDSIQLTLQLPLIDACKEAGVKRFIPCDTATACVKGVMQLNDNKREIHEYIEKIGVPHTYIDVGWWVQLGIPITDTSMDILPFNPQNAAIFYAIIPIVGAEYIIPSDPKQAKRSAMTDLRDVGRFVARIVADDRTINRYVFCWAEEKTQEEIWEIFERASGIKPEKKEKTEAQLRDEFKPENHHKSFHLAGTQYMYSMWVRGDNTVENAKKPEYGGALDARELYPDLKPKTIEEYVTEIYKNAGKGKYKA